jgi:hypothetical protein
MVCPCGAKTTTTKEQYGIGAVMSETGWFHVSKGEFDRIYLCPTCTRQAKMLAAQLVVVLGSNKVTLSSFG